MQSAGNCLAWLQVVLAPDPDLAEHLLLHGVMVAGSTAEGNRLHRAFLIQVGSSLSHSCPGSIAKVYDIQHGACASSQESESRAG